MMFLLFLLALVAPNNVVVTTSLAAQSRLAEALADADSVDWIRSDRAHHQVTFRIDRAGEAYEIIAVTRRQGSVTEVAIHDAGPGRHVGALSWLADAMHDTAAVTNLDVAADGTVTLVTDDGTRYQAITSHDRGNAVVESRWAAAWNRS